VNKYAYKETTTPVSEHFAFISSFGDKHIRQASIEYYKTCSGQTEVMYECRTTNGLLIGICFAAIFGQTTRYTITVVHKDYRQQGIGTALLILRTQNLQSVGIHTEARTVDTNIASMKMCRKVFPLLKSDPNDTTIQWFGDK